MSAARQRSVGRRPIPTCDVRFRGRNHRRHARHGPCASGQRLQGPSVAACDPLDQGPTDCQRLIAAGRSRLEVGTWPSTKKVKTGSLAATQSTESSWEPTRARPYTVLGPRGDHQRPRRHHRRRRSGGGDLSAWSARRLVVESPSLLTDVKIKALVVASSG